MELNTEVDSIGTGPRETVVDTGASLLASGCVTAVDSPKIIEEVEGLKVEDITGATVEVGGVMGWVDRTVVVEEGSNNTVVLCVTAI